MSVTAAWDNEQKTILRCTYVGTWTWQDFGTAMAEVSTLLASTDHRVDMIIDMRQSNSIPSSPLFHIPRPGQIPSNGGTTVIVGASMFLKMLGDIMRKVYGPARTTFAIVDTLDQAYELIKQQADAEGR